MKKFIIFTPSYNEKSGGVIVLHKLCHLLNELGREAYLVPHFDNHVISKHGLIIKIYRFVKIELKRILKGFKVNEAFNTPVFNGDFEKIDWDDWIVIYPEIVLGNPLGAKNIVRWLLHQPGFLSGIVQYGKKELYFKFNDAIHDFDYPGSCTSKNHLKVIHYPLEYYNLEGVSKERAGTAYCLRKGRNKEIQHDLADSVLIDDLPHAEVAKIFKKVERFISYDVLTAYSIFAVLCGCESIVVPDEGISKEEWYPNPEDRYGISYGFNDYDCAHQSKALVKQRIVDEQSKVVANIKKAISEMDVFFDINKYE